VAVTEATDSLTLSLVHFKAEIVGGSVGADSM